MANYYKMFQDYVEKENLKGRKFSIRDFERRMALLYGFGGRNRSLNRWMHNFRDVRLIKTITDDGVRYVLIL